MIPESELGQIEKIIQCHSCYYGRKSERESQILMMMPSLRVTENYSETNKRGRFTFFLELSFMSFIGENFLESPSMGKH